MRMTGLALALSLAPACSDDAPTGACGDVPELVMKFEPGQLARAGRPYQTGEQVMLTVRSPSGSIARYTGERCGDGVPEQIVSAELELDQASTITTHAGPLSFGYRSQTGELLRFDRLDAPGDSQPIRILDPSLGGYGGTALLGGGLLLWEDLDNVHAQPPLAMPDSARVTLQFYPGPGGFAAPPVALADDLVWFDAFGGADTLYALNAAGDLLAITGIGDHEVVQTGVRTLNLSPDRTQMAWQAQSDGGSEPLSLRTLATGTEVSLGVIDPGVIASWLWTDDALALIGPEATMVRAHARQDGALLPPPPSHIPGTEFGSYSATRDLFILFTAEPFAQVGLAWDPLADTVVEWYRGPQTGDFPYVYPVAEGLRYAVHDGTDTSSSLWLNRLDGRPAELLVPDYNINDAVHLPDGRIVMRLDATFGVPAPLGLIDPRDGSLKLLASDIDNWGFGRDWTEVLYTRDDGPDAGVWARPI